jgi:uncharacterized RDD family membrane protein YckC
VRSAVRAVGWVVDAITLVVPVALWSAWFSPGHRRVGDFLAGTFVVRHGTEHTLAGPAAGDATAGGG